MLTAHTMSIMKFTNGMHSTINVRIQFPIVTGLYSPFITVICLCCLTGLQGVTIENRLNLDNCKGNADFFCYIRLGPKTCLFLQNGQKDLADIRIKSYA